MTIQCQIRKWVNHGHSPQTPMQDLPSEQLCNRDQVITISVRSGGKRGTNQNGEMFPILGPGTSSPQVSTLTLHDLSMGNHRNRMTHAYATEPTRANAIRAPRGPAVLIACAEPRNNPVPNVPAI